jgi:MFS family permease
MLEVPEPVRESAIPKVHASPAWWAVVARFLVHGLVVSTWVSRIPGIQASLKLSNGALGLSLLGAAFGSIIAIPICGWMVSRFGSSRVTTWSSAGFCVALVLPALAVDATTLFAALFIYGAAAGTNDVAMNSQGVAVEIHVRTPTMSRFHAMFSLGGMAGAAVGAAIAARHVPPVWHFALGGLLCLIITLSTTPLMLEVHDHKAEKSKGISLRRLPPVLIALSAIGFCMFLSEGAMADWIGVYLKQVLSAGPGAAAAGYAAFSAGMAIFRLLGDAITLRLGPAMTVRAGALVAALGLLLALAAPSPYWALPGFAISGAGFSVIIPLVFGAGGRVKGVSRGAGVATVGGIGYLGFVFGPPAIGFVSQISSLRWALLIVVGLCVLAAVLAGAVNQNDEAEAAA